MRTSLLTVFCAFLLLGSLSACGMETEKTKDERKEFSNTIEPKSVQDGTMNRAWRMDEKEPGSPHDKNAPNDKNHTSDMAKYPDDLIRIK